MPFTFAYSLDKLADTIIDYLNAQIEHGAQAVMIFDTWGGVLTTRDYKEFSLRYMQKIVDGLNRVGWTIEKPKGTMFVWAKIPEQYLKMGSVEFSKLLIKTAKVAVSPGAGFGEYGDDYVRFALIENPHRIRQAIRGIKQVL